MVTYARCRIEFTNYQSLITFHFSLFTSPSLFPPLSPRFRGTASELTGAVR
jgi:hypothetical protein